MSIQIGTGAITTASQSAERIVLQSSYSNLIHLTSSTSNNFIKFDGYNGPFQFGISNTALSIINKDRIVSSYTSTQVVVNPPTTINNVLTISASSPTNGLITPTISASNLVISGYPYQDPVFKIVNPNNPYPNPNALTFNIGTGYMGIGISPTEMLHVSNNIRSEQTIYASNLTVGVLTPNTPGVPIYLNGSSRIFGDLTLTGNLIYASDTSTQVLTNIIITDLADIASIKLAPTNAKSSIYGTHSVLISTSNIVELNVKSTDSNVYPVLTLSTQGYLGLGTKTPRALIHGSLTNASSNVPDMFRLENKYVNAYTSNIAGCNVTMYGSNIPYASTFIISSNLCIGIGTLTPQYVLHATNVRSNKGFIYMDSNISRNPTNVFTVNSNAWVGIGTPQPSAPLSITTSNIANPVLIALTSNIVPTPTSVFNINQINTPMITSNIFNGSTSNIYGSNINYLVCSSNSIPLLTIDSYGHIFIGSNANAVSAFDPNYSIKGEGIAQFPTVETMVFRAPATAYTEFYNNPIRYFTIYDRFFTTSNTSNYVDNANSLYVVFSCNVVTSNIYSCNVTTYITSGAYTSNISFIESRKTITTGIVNSYPQAGFSLDNFWVPVTTESITVALSNLSNYLVTSNLVNTQSNIDLQKTSLSNIFILHTDTLTSTNQINANNLLVLNTYTSNLNVNGSLTTSNIVVQGFSVNNNIATISVDNLMFSGAYAAVFGARTTSDLTTDIYTNGRIISQIYGSPPSPFAYYGINNVYGNASKALTLIGDQDVSVHIKSTKVGGRPMVEFNSGNILTSTWPNSLGYVGLDNDYTMIMGYKAEQYPRVKFLQNAVVINNRMAFTNTGVSFSSEGYFTPTQVLHVRGNMLVETTSSPYTPSLYVDVNNTRVGIGISAPAYTHHVNGTQFVSDDAIFNKSVTVTSNLTVLNTLSSTRNIYTTSDSNLKTDLTRIDNALDRIAKLTGYTYTRIDTGTRETGLIAQDMMTVLPEAVSSSSFSLNLSNNNNNNNNNKNNNNKNNNNYLSIAYGNLAGLLIEGIKELKSEVDKLKVKLN